MERFRVVYRDPDGEGREAVVTAKTATDAILALDDYGSKARVSSLGPAEADDLGDHVPEPPPAPEPSGDDIFAGFAR